MAFIATSIKAISTGFRSQGPAGGLLALPAVLALAGAFCYAVYPQLSPGTQNAIDNGVLGMMMGIGGGMVLFGALVAFWQSGIELWRGRRG